MQKKLRLREKGLNQDDKYNKEQMWDLDPGLCSDFKSRISSIYTAQLFSSQKNQGQLLAS